MTSSRRMSLAVRGTLTQISHLLYQSKNSAAFAFGMGLGCWCLTGVELARAPFFKAICLVMPRRLEVCTSSNGDSSGLILQTA